jgi:hypothetical protein
MILPYKYLHLKSDDTANLENDTAQTREEGDEEGYENTSGPFSQENLQAMGQQVGEQMFQEIKTTTKEEAVHAMHKVEDKIDRQTDKWIEDMSNRVQSQI